MRLYIIKVGSRYYVADDEPLTRSLVKAAKYRSGHAAADNVAHIKFTWDLGPRIKVSARALSCERGAIRRREIERCASHLADC